MAADNQTPAVSSESRISAHNMEVSDVIAFLKQQQDIETKALEIELETVKKRDQILRTESNNQLEIAKHTNDTIAKDRQRDRVLIIAIVIITFLFVLVMLYMNKDSLVMDLIKVGLGFLGGFGLARMRQPSE